MLKTLHPPTTTEQRNGLLLSIGARACDAPRNHHRSYEVESFSPLNARGVWQDLAKELSNEQHRWVLKHGAGSERVVDSSELEEIRVLSAQELERRMRSDVVKRNPNYLFTWRQSAVNHYISNYIAGAILRSCLKMSCWSVPCKQLLSCLAVEDERTHLLRVSSQFICACSGDLRTFSTLWLLHEIAHSPSGQSLQSCYRCYWRFYSPSILAADV